MNDMAVDIGESIIAASVAVSQTFVIQPERMQDRGVEVGHGDFVFGDVVSEFVGLSVSGPASDSPASHPDTERVWMMIPAIVSLGCGRPSELGGEHNQGILQQASRFEIGQ